MIKILFDLLTRKPENLTLKERKIRKEEEEKKDKCKDEIRHQTSDDIQHNEENKKKTSVSVVAKCKLAIKFVSFLIIF